MSEHDEAYQGRLHCPKCHQRVSEDATDGIELVLPGRQRWHSTCYVRTVFDGHTNYGSLRPALDRAIELLESTGDEVAGDDAAALGSVVYFMDLTLPVRDAL